MNGNLIMLSESAIDKLQALGSADAQLKHPDYWGSVGIIALTGILVVFLILAILIAFFYGLGAIFKAVDKSKRAKKAAQTLQIQKAAPVVEAAPAVEDVEEVNDDELIAVIAAAVAAYSEGEFTIRSVRKSKTKARSAWSAAGIAENTRPF